MTTKISFACRLFFVLSLSWLAWPAMGESSSTTPDSGGAERQSTSALPNMLTFTIKGAQFRLLDETQTAHRQEWEFDESASDFYALEGEGRLPFLGRRIAIGGEYLRFRTTAMRAGAGGGDTYAEHVRGAFVKAKYFFGSTSAFQPYAGVGIGSMSMPDDGPSGPIETSSDGWGFQGFAGLQWRSKHVGLRAEVTYLDAPEFKDHSSEVLDMSGLALSLGVSLFFGR